LFYSPGLASLQTQPLQFILIKRVLSSKETDRSHIQKQIYSVNSAAAVILSADDAHQMRFFLLSFEPALIV